MLRFILLILLSVTFTAVASQNKEDTVLYSKIDHLKLQNAQLNLEIQTLRLINDSLRAKLYDLLEYHSYSCPVLESLYSNGKLAKKRQYYESVEKFYKRYPPYTEK